MFSLAFVLAGVGLVVMALLAAPASLAVHVERTDRFRTRWRVRGLFGLVDTDLGRKQRSRPERTRRSTKTKKPRRAALERSLSKLRRGPAVALALVRTEGFVWRIVRLVKDLGQRVSYHDVHAHVDFGLDDPADTGRLYGALAPFLVAATTRGFDVRCRPDFEGSGLRGSCGARIQMRPLSMMSVLVKFLCSPSVLRGVRAAWAARR